MHLKRLLNVVWFTLCLAKVLKTFVSLCSLRSPRANTIWASVGGSDMFNGVVVDGQLAKKRVIESRDWLTRLKYVCID
jgi:hypothetical protein